uniref:FHA domain-containing protein n=1 Tax=Panagrolaimus sp. JU765 TaxID=591449 RepID=A0AC34QEM4_9BILA
MTTPSTTKSISQKPHCAEKDAFPIPNWAGMPPHGAHLDCIKNDKLVQKLFVDELTHYYFGRNVDVCEIPVEHASCSRVHAVLVYHKYLNRFALIDLGSSPLTPIFLDVGTKFYFGASTRRFVIREKFEPKVEKEDEKEKNENLKPKQVLPENEEELDHLTEYNTAQNRRIPVIEQSQEEARKKKKNRAKLTFAAEEVVIDLDAPDVGRFQNLVQTTIVPRKRKLDESVSEFPTFAARPKIVLRKLQDFGDDEEEKEEDSFSSILGVRLNVAPDLDHLDPTTITSHDEEHHQHKKYVKEVWPGRKPTHPIE